MHSIDAHGMANSIDHDQRSSLILVCIVCSYYLSKHIKFYDIICIGSNNHMNCGPAMQSELTQNILHVNMQYLSSISIYLPFIILRTLNGCSRVMARPMAFRYFFRWIKLDNSCSLKEKPKRNIILCLYTTFCCS